MIPIGYVQADTDGLLYKIGDTYWLNKPSVDDPGVLAPKAGAISLEQSEAEQDAVDFYGNAFWEEMD